MNNLLYRGKEEKREKRNTKPRRKLSLYHPAPPKIPALQATQQQTAKSSRNVGKCMSSIYNKV